MNGTSQGTVVSVRGSVIDVRFNQTPPPIHNMLHAGKDGRIVIEMLAQRHSHYVRSIALTLNQGLPRAQKNIAELPAILRNGFHRLRQSSIDEALFEMVPGFEALRD